MCNGWSSQEWERYERQRRELLKEQERQREQLRVERERRAGETREREMLRLWQDEQLRRLESELTRERERIER